MTSVNNKLHTEDKLIKNYEDMSYLLTQNNKKIKRKQSNT